jgi:hypothetical protein
MLLRAQRATAAHAVLLVRDSDGRVLASASPTGGVRLPQKQLDPWMPIAFQIEEWLEELLLQGSTPFLIAIDGTPGPRGVTFLYAASIESVLASNEGVWLEPDIATLELSSEDGRLLSLTAYVCA